MDGDATFEFTARDDLGVEDASPAIATITVNPINDVPLPGNQQISNGITEDSTTLITDINLLASATDQESDPIDLVYVASRSRYGATITQDGQGLVSYDPSTLNMHDLNEGDNSADILQYFITDRPYSLQTGSLSGNDVDSYTITTSSFSGANAGDVLYVSFFSDLYLGGDDTWITSSIWLGQFDANGNPLLGEDGYPNTVHVFSNSYSLQRTLQVQFNELGQAHVKVTGSYNNSFIDGYDHGESGDYTIAFSLAPIASGQQYIPVAGMNDAPGIDPALMDVSVLPYDSAPIEVSIQSLLQNVSDVDSNAVQGVAIISEIGLGTFEFNAGSGWVSISDISLWERVAHCCCARKIYYAIPQILVQE